MMLYINGAICPVLYIFRVWLCQYFMQALTIEGCLDLIVTQCFMQYHHLHNSTCVFPAKYSLTVDYLETGYPLSFSGG